MSKKKKLWTVLSMLEWATEYFEQKGIPDPRLSIEWLLADTLSLKRLDLYLNYDRPLSSEELDELRPKVKRRSLHEPLQYITGSSEFMNCRILVNPAVLIPRTETEQLVEIIINDHIERKDDTISLLDIGTGSGCIPVAIAKAMPNWNCTGIDISEKVLETAEKNAELNSVSVEFIREDLFNLSIQNRISGRQFDLIISNPPYILPSEKNSLEKQVIEYEPVEALIHKKPLDIYKRIGEFARTSLVQNGSLYVECNDSLSGQIKVIFQQYFDKVDIVRDYDKKDRFVKAVKSR
jgi:release factor glutamine methyltransferase